MVGSQDPSEKSGNANNTGDDSLIPTTLTFTPTLKEFQYWAKSHRTFVASSASGSCVDKNATIITTHFADDRLLQWRPLQRAYFHHYNGLAT
ncbi:hypothetical protein ACLMJK_007341 [Lecanora helva]